jgi:hypothetical protein
VPPSAAHVGRYAGRCLALGAPELDRLQKTLSLDAPAPPSFTFSKLSGVSSPLAAVSGTSSRGIRAVRRPYPISLTLPSENPTLRLTVLRPVCDSSCCTPAALPFMRHASAKRNESRPGSATYLFIRTGRTLPFGPAVFNQGALVASRTCPSRQSDSKECRTIHAQRPFFPA